VANLIDRLYSLRDSVYMFMKDFDVPFTNNLAEQTMRSVKPKTKVIGCFRTVEGAAEFVGIESVLSIARKHGIDAVKVLRLILGDQYDTVVKES